MSSHSSQARDKKAILNTTKSSRSVAVDTTVFSDIATDEIHLSEDEDPASQVPRAVSPTPTEIIDDPPVEEILERVRACGIKIRDFALQEQHKIIVKPVPEVFDPYRAVAEFEYRLGVKTIRYPVPGKTLRRLLDLGWVTPEEVEERCTSMHLEALSTYDERVAQDVKEGRGVYPWRALKWTSVPTMQERKNLVVKHMWHFVAVDRARKRLEELESEAQRSKEQAEEDEKLAREILERREREGKVQPVPVVLLSLTLPKLFGDESSRKRSLSNTAKKDNGNNQAYDGDDKDFGNDAHGQPKRIRLSPEGSFSTCHPHPSSEESLPLIPPAKQYPAPLSSYAPDLYPEVASIISSKSQMHQQHKPPAVSLGKDTVSAGSQRECTPPVEEASLSRLQRSGKLARTQTFTLL